MSCSSSGSVRARTFGGRKDSHERSRQEMKEVPPRQMESITISKGARSLNQSRRKEWPSAPTKVKEIEAGPSKMGHGALVVMCPASLKRKV